MKTPMEKIIQWVMKNAFNVTAEDGTTYIAIDAEEMRLNYDLWLDEEKEHIIEAYVFGFKKDDFRTSDEDVKEFGREFYNQKYQTK